MNALQQKQKPLALSYLRSRKQLEDLLNKRLASLGTLESTLVSIETATGDVQVSLHHCDKPRFTEPFILAHENL